MGTLRHAKIVKMAIPENLINSVKIVSQVIEVMVVIIVIKFACCDIASMG